MNDRLTKCIFSIVEKKNLKSNRFMKQDLKIPCIFMFCAFFCALKFYAFDNLTKTNASNRYFIFFERFFFNENHQSSQNIEIISQQVLVNILYLRFKKKIKCFNFLTFQQSKFLPFFLLQTWKWLEIKNLF